jgi:menaquinol-cytochrome c reductase iron-sulfur subunit
MTMVSNTRRQFLSRLSGVVVAAAGVVSAWPLFRSLVPNFVYEPPKKFNIGNPDRFPEGVTYVEDRRIYVFRESGSFYAISGVCTHLGCSVKFSPYKKRQEQTVRKHSFASLGEFHCPCHGSKFYGEGTNFAGPAPKPLKWHPVEVSRADGGLIVDMSKQVNRDFRLVV